MPSALAELTKALTQRATRIAPGSSAAAGALESATASLEAAAANAATTAAQWTSALAEWRTKLTELGAAAFPGEPPARLLLEVVSYRLPPVPGIDNLLGVIPLNIPLNQLDRWRADLNGAAKLGPISLGAIIPAVTVKCPTSATGDVIGLAPPTGVSISLDAGVARGGGSLSFSDQPHWRLAGSFGLSLGPVSVSALGILERPGGTLSLLMLLGARFTPGIQLGFGFAISGVGGLIGANRRADTAALRRKLSSGEATEALFADDPSSNAPAILDTLGQLFVPAPGSFVVGPTLQLSWLKLGPVDFLRLDLGLFIEMPGPSRIVLVGRAIAEVGVSDLKLIHFQLDIAGEVDFVRNLVNIRASLVDSHALGVFKLAGDATIIFCWGSPPYQILSIGGFYPGFNPAPAVVEPMRRVSMSVGFDGLPGLSMRFEAYVAATTNSFQLGGRLELAINIGITAEGHVALDAIFQFQPFLFDVDVSGSLRVGVLGQTFAGVDVHGHISGPGPIVIRAAISIDLWIDDFTWSDTFTIGRRGNTAPAPIELIPELARSLSTSNIHSRGGADRLVAVCPRPAGDIALVSPIGSLLFTQRSAPLNLRLERYGGVKLKTPTKATIAPTDAGVTMGLAEKDYFAPGTYLDLTTAEAMNQPPYDRLDAGFELGFSNVAADPKPYEVKYKEYYRGRPWPLTPLGDLRAFDGLVLALGGKRKAPGAVTDRSPVIAANDEEWGVHLKGGGFAPAASRTEAHVEVKLGNAEVALPTADAPVSLAGVA